MRDWYFSTDRVDILTDRDFSSYSHIHVKFIFVKLTKHIENEHLFSILHLEIPFKS